MNTMNGQVALVTGGGRGIGRGIALALAAQGVAVAIDDLHRGDGVAPAAATVADIERAGGKGLALYEDVASEEGVRRMVDATVDRFGRLDILVMCAANNTQKLLQELSADEWDATIRVHLRGTFLGCRMAVPHMLKNNHGRIITVASRGAFYQLPPSKKDPRPPRRPSNTPYAAAKAGILGFTTSLAGELWDTGITVNCLLPSANTQLFPATQARMVGGVPATESLDPEDIAPSVVYLCSPEAADISGQLMYASGGDMVFYGHQLDMHGARMVRKQGRWTQEELKRVVPGILGLDRS